jgi:hypothetical protein
MRHRSAARLWLAALLAALALLPVRLTAQPAPGRLTLAQYQAALLESKAQLEAAPVAAQPATLDRVRARLATIAEVALPSGQVVQVVPLLGPPDAPAPPFAAAVIRLRSVRQQIDAARGDDTAARLARLAAVFARPEFNRPADLWDRFVNWLADWLSRILPVRTRARGLPGWVTEVLPWVLAGLGALAVGWLLSYWLQGLLRSFVADAELQRRGANGDALPQTAAEARIQARRAAETGRYRDAVRALYLAALLHLQEQQLAPNDPSLTNHELLDRIPADAPLHAALAPVVETFDEVWYGVREPDHATYQAYARSVEALEAGARGQVEQA